jgi:hypothetical protein
LTQLRAIGRADPLIHKLYLGELIDLKMAELMGGKDDEKKKQAARALAAIKAIPRNGDDANYRKQVNECVRRAFAKRKPTPLDTILKLLPKLTAAQLR